MKYVYRWNPFDAYDMVYTESWLDAQAQKGLFLENIGHLFSKFKKGEPKAVRYRLEAVRDPEEIPDEEEKAFYAASGWEYVDTKSRTYHVFKAEDPASPELHTDPAVQLASLKKVRRRALTSSILSIAIMVVCSFIFFGIAFGEDAPLLSSVKDGLWKPFWFSAMILLDIIVSVANICSMSKVFRRLRRGELIPHNIPYKLQGCLTGLSLFVLLVVCFGWYVMGFVTIGWGDTYTVSNYSGTMPFVTLTELEGADEDDIDSFEIDGVNWASFIDVGRDLFVPRKMELDQSLGKKQYLYGEWRQPSLRLRYYEFSFDTLA